MDSSVTSSLLASKARPSEDAQWLRTSASTRRARAAPGVQDPYGCYATHAHYVRVSGKGQTRCMYDRKFPSHRNCVFLWTENISQGTAQFMAMAILGKKDVVYEAAHDVESFIWVLSYCVMRSLLIRCSISKHPEQEVKDQCQAFRRLFSAAFAQTTFKKIEITRSHKSPALTFPEDEDVDRVIKNFMSKSLVDLFAGLRGLIWAVEKPFGGVQLTHDDLLKLVDKAISESL